MQKLTLVTGLFDLKRRETSDRRSVEDYFRFGDFTLGLDQDMVFFSDPELAERISDERRKRGRSHRTHIVPIAFEDLSAAKYLERIKQGRPVRNLNETLDATKDTPNYILIGWSKFELLERTAALKPFEVSHLGWIDFGIARTAKLYERASLELFANPPDKVRIHMMRYFDEKNVRFPDYWNYRWGHMAAGFFLGSIENILELTASFWSTVETAIVNNYGPAEEGIVPVIVGRKWDRFSFSYGGYEDILRNHIRLRGGGKELLFQMRDARSRNAWSHSLAIGREVIASHSEGIFECQEENLADLIMEYYLAAHYGSTRDEAQKAALYYANQVRTNSAFRAAYLGNRISVKDNFSLMESPIFLPESTNVESPLLEMKPKESVKTEEICSSGRPSIILASMIKNESKIISRMLDSVSAVATHFCLVDTGSTDNTVDVIRGWGEKQRSPLAVYSVPFVDFGTTRTETVQKAVQWARSLNLDLNNTYLLLLDADMILETIGFEADQLKEDNYRIVQDQGSLAYSNTRLVRASKATKYIGRTHEYVDTVGTVADLHTLLIKDVGDGGCKADKFERDVRLLEKDLEEKPDNCRSMYYLATSYEALGRHAEAIAMYSKRADAPGWEEEAWMAHYRRGITKELSGDKIGAAKDYADAWARRPWRAEPLFKLANLALNQGQHQKACALAKAGVSIPYPKDDILFIEKGCYNDGFHQILAISDFYTGGHYDGAKHCDHLILSGSQYCQNALQNATWYMKPIKASQTINLGEMFKAAIPQGQKPCNPSIIRRFDREKGAFRYSLSMRTVNYSHNPDGSYTYPGNHIQTVTLHCELDHELRAGSARALENAKSRPNARIRGIEDVRLYQDRLLDTNTYGIGGRSDECEDMPHIFACVWREGKLVSCRRLSERGKRMEKNWLPIMNQYVEEPQEAPPNLLYNTWPELIILDGASLQPRYKAPLPTNLYDCRGSSNVIRYLGGWLWVVHQATILPGHTKRKYLHRLCWSRGNQDGPTIDGFRTTLPFCFEKSQIEFCCGACVGPNGSLLLTYGIECNNAFLSVVDENVVASMLGI